jgi:subtilase family serine protease
MRTRIALLALVIATLVVASPLAAGEHPMASGSATGAAGAVTTDAAALPPGASATLMGGSSPLEISLTLAYPHPASLSRFLSAVEDPASPMYRAYLTHAQFESTFAPTASSASTVVAGLDAAGAKDVAVAPDRLSVMGKLTVSEVDALFGVRMVDFGIADGSPLYTALGTATLPSDLQGLVSGISGLSNAADLRLSLNLAAGRLAAVSAHAHDTQFIVNNSTGEQWSIGSDFTQAFQATGLFPGNTSVVNPLNATYPSGVAIATLLASGYNATTSNNTPPWDPAVIHAYFNDTFQNDSPSTKWPQGNLTGVPVTVAGDTPPLPGNFTNGTDDTLNEFENSLDLEMAGSLAPGAPLYNFYFGGNLLVGAISDADAASYFDLDLASALSYNYTPAHLGVVSASFGITDLNDSTWNHELQEAAATGVTVVASSGDQGNAPDSLSGRGNGQWLVWPASAAFNTSGVLSVGGVSLGFTGTPNGWVNATNISVAYDPTLGHITNVSAWWSTNGGPGTYEGTEGGASVVYPEPSWQFGSAAQPNIVNATVVQGASALGRSGPDLAFPANATIAYVEANSTGTIFGTVLEGTSIAAPAFAGFVADEVAVSNHLFGFLDPEVYRIASYFAAHPSPTDPFYDVTNGSNYVFSAGPGWDATTGWGLPFAPLFYAADGTPAIRDYVYTGPTPVLPVAAPPPPVPWTEIYIIFGVGAAVAIVLVIVMARPLQGSGVPPPPPSYGPMPPSAPGTFPTSVYNGPTFLCPYCGALRPAEPVRCPRCGAL